MKTIEQFKVLCLGMALAITSSGICLAEDSGPSSIGDIADKVDIHGFISQGYISSSDNNYLGYESDGGTFDVNEIGVNFSADLNEKLRAGIQLFSRRHGEIEENDILIDWAYGDYSWQDWLGLRVGKFKNYAGLYNETRDLDMLRVFTTLPQSVYNDLYRDTTIALTGVGIYGNLPLKSLGSFDYQAGYGTTSIPNDGAVAWTAEEAGWYKVKDFEVDHKYYGSLIWNTPLNGLRLGGSYVQISLDMNTVTTIENPLGPMIPLPPGTPITYDVDKNENVTLSAEWTYGDLVLAAEYLDMHRETELSLFPGKTDLDSEGWYISGTYRFNDWLETGMYYSEHYPDSDDKDGDRYADTNEEFRAWQKDLAATVRFDFNEYWLLKLEGHYMDGAALCSPNNNDTFEEDWFQFAAKTTFNF